MRDPDSHRRARIHALFVVLAAFFYPPWSGETSPSHPNVIFILADDLGYGDLSCQNPESKIPTPNIDRLASEGIRFTDAHSPSSVCSPTRYGILSGRFAWRTSLKKGVLWPWDEPLIEPGRLTVAQLFKDHGYNTACIGKWHLGWGWPTTDGSRFNDCTSIGEFREDCNREFAKKVDFQKPVKGGPLDRGFEYYFGDDVPNFPPYCFIENERLLGNPTFDYPGESFSRAGPMIEGWKMEDVLPRLTQKAVDFIKAPAGKKPFYKTEGKPFFLYFPLTAPHTPIAPAEEFRGKSEAGLYGDFVFEVDWVVGQVMEALEESGQTEDTLLIFTSDNGSPGRDGTEMNGPANSVRRFGHNPSGRFRGIKADIWEGGHRIPFIVKWPGRINPGRVSDETVCLVDFMATCAAILEIELPVGSAEDSWNILPALIGKPVEEPIREATVHHSSRGMFAIRRGNWKLIFGKGSGGWSGSGEETDASVQLYNLEEDIGELNNLQNDHPEIIAELTGLMEKYKREGKSVR